MQQETAEQELGLWQLMPVCRLTKSVLLRHSVNQSKYNIWNAAKHLCHFKLIFEHNIDFHGQIQNLAIYQNRLWKKKDWGKIAYISKGQNLNWRFQHCNSNTTSKSKALRVLQPLTSLYLGSVDLLQGVSFNMLAIPWSSRTRLCRWSGNGLGLPLTPCSLNHVARENPMNEDCVLYFSVVQCCLV